jgi:homocysteine S-methyltransferase
MQIPAPIRARMTAVTTPDEGRRQGMLIAREMLAEVKDDVVGAYIMPQFGRYRTAVEVLQPLGYDFGPEDRGGS